VAVVPGGKVVPAMLLWGVGAVQASASTECVATASPFNNVQVVLLWCCSIREQKK